MGEFGPEEFIFTSQLWFIADKSTVKHDPKTGAPDLGDGTGVVCGKTSGKDCVAIFTDLDLAQRFITQNGVPDLVPASFDTRQGFVAFLRRLAEVGHSTIGV